MPKRILVTGSRDWTNETTIVTELLHAAGHINPLLRSEVILISGACPTGADSIAEKWWTVWGGTVERHPADWQTHGKKAGFVRNAEMVNLGADVCLAFIKDHSKGATMTAELAKKAGIEVVLRREGI
jgi:hypothetical protein